VAKKANTATLVGFRDALTLLQRVATDIELPRIAQKLSICADWVGQELEALKKVDAAIQHVSQKAEGLASAVNEAGGKEAAT
jgi:hypothetical protein